MGSFTGAQCRMARALLKMSKQDLATLSNVGLSTIHAMEATDTIPACRESSIDAVYSFFISTGKIEFIGPDTVRIKTMTQGYVDWKS
jgi:predicted transcriptional regulator